MNTPTVRTRFALLLAPLVLAVLAATSSAFACVVGTGTSASCTEAALDACLPGGGSFDGTVTFACGGAATITVTSTKTISANATIDGGSLITISGGGMVGVFVVNSGVTFTVQNLTIADAVGAPCAFGTCGGAIFNNNGGVLTVTNSTFSGNSARIGGAIYNGSGATLTVTNSTFSGNSGGAIINIDGSTLTVTDSTFSGNSASGGGAISNIHGSTLTVTDSTFSGNSAFGGGAIDNEFGILTVTNSTFSGNSARIGGAISNFDILTVTNSTFSGNSAAGGGAIDNEEGGIATVTNSTFFGNSASQDGGAIFNRIFGTLTVTNSTFSGNSAATNQGGAISNGGTLTVTNSIVANSTSGDNCVVSGGVTITDGGHNIDDGTTCGFTGANCATTTGTSFCNTNPLLDPAGLARNGGPTQTIALEAGSSAINAGNETICAAPPVNNLDQRGFVRPGMGATNCSIGAYEANAAPSATTTTITSTSTSSTTSTTSPAFECVVGTGTSASCTEAALDACLPAGSSFSGTVTFACGGAATITVTGTKFISADTTIDGGSVITISGAGKKNGLAVFSVNSGVTFAVENLTIADGFASGRRGGGAILNNLAGTLSVTNSTFSGNSAPFGGGAILNNLAGTLSVTNSTFSGNSGLLGGGAIANDGGIATVTNSTFSGNSTAPGFGDGGAIANGGTLSVTNSTFSGNSAGLSGGAIINSLAGTLSVTNSTFFGNSAFEGGAISHFLTLTVTNSTFFGNSAFEGGAIFNGSKLTVTNCTFSGNSAPGGGAIWSDNSRGLQEPVTVMVVNSILANSASGGNCGVGPPGTITDGGHNIDDGTTCGFTGAGCATTTGTSFCNTTPLLDPAGLARNGGPTQTIALEAGSPAINAGNETICAAPPVNNLDQRGFVRPGMGATNCSIGAYEANAAPPTLPGCAGFPCSDDGTEVSLCHIPPGNPRNSQTLCIGLDAVPAHLNHGDHCGPCR